ncbi:MAG: hypothetical protein QME81_16525, partial [bacterium]|nr:hypothetical protein [bacterium]
SAICNPKLVWLRPEAALRGTHRIRVLVLSEMPEGEHNSIWYLFSGVQEKVLSGATQYRKHTVETSTIINQLFDNYQLEGVFMPYTMKDFQRDYVKEHLNVLTPEEVLQRFSAEEVLQRFSAEEVLQRFSAEEIKAYLEKQKKRKH